MELALGFAYGRMGIFYKVKDVGILEGQIIYTINSFLARALYYQLGRFILKLFTMSSNYITKVAIIGVSISR